MTLRVKLLLAQLPLALALVVVGVASRAAIGALDRNARNILADNQLSVVAAERMRDDADALGRAARRHTGSGGERDARRSSFERDLQFQEGNVTEAGEREMTERLRSSWLRFSAQLDDDSLIDVERALDAIIAVNQAAMVRKREKAQHGVGRMSSVLVLATLAALLVGLLASTYLTNRLTRPLAVLATAVRRLGGGEVDARARLSGHDEIARVAHEFDTMADRLAEYRSSSLGELLQAQQSSQAAIDGLPDPVLLVRADGALSHANQAATALFDVDTEAFGDAVLARAPKEVAKIVARLREHIASGQGAYLPKSLEEAVPIEVREGTRYFLTRANPLRDAEGRPAGLCLLFQDVTRLRRFDELRNDVVATVAHEFRTPLTSLRMAIHLCVDGAVGPLSDKQLDLLTAARDDCERLRGIVDDLLDLSRISEGRIELHARAMSSRALIVHALEMQRAAAAEKSVALTLGALTVDRPVEADPDRLQLVLTNLVQNAIRYTPAGGSVELRAAPEAGAMRFEVSDTGAGIAREYLSRLFERFYRVPGSPPGGAGLGLYICKEIVEAHGGRVGVESDPGRGSIFWFTLPLAAAGGEVSA